MKKKYDVAIIGGGASGLAAAITAKRNRPSLSVAIFEKKEVAQSIARCLKNTTP